MTAATPSIQGVPLNLPNEKMHRMRMATAINQIVQGKMNVNQTVTLRASHTTTTVTDARIGPNSAILLTPTAAHAATAYVAGIYVTNQLPSVGTTPGSLTLNHASSANTDQTFTLTILG
jgi:hypothetical protein